MCPCLCMCENAKECASPLEWLCKRNAEGILFKRIVFKEQGVSKGDSTEGSRVWTVLVQSSLPLKKNEKKRFLKCIQYVFLEEERILGEIKRKQWSQTEREFTNRPERNKREGVVDWKARRRKSGGDGKRERAGHIGEHWPGALLRAFFLPFLQETRRGGKKREETRKNKNPLSTRTYGSSEAGGAPYSRTHLTSAQLEWWLVNYHVSGPVPCHASSLTHT